jgi:hypothetical protein
MKTRESGEDEATSPVRSDDEWWKMPIHDGVGGGG